MYVACPVNCSWPNVFTCFVLLVSCNDSTLDNKILHEVCLVVAFYNSLPFFSGWMMIVIKPVVLNSCEILVYWTLKWQLVIQRATSGGAGEKAQGGPSFPPPKICGSIYFLGWVQGMSKTLFKIENNFKTP